MLCPKCRTEAMVKRDKGVSVDVCRNPNCPNYRKVVRPTNLNRKKA